MAIDPIIKEKADDIRNKIYGKEVRESLASGLEEMSTDVVDTVSRQGNVESQFQDVIENTTDKDVISAPEIIAARNGEANLKARLDKENQEVTTQLAQKATVHDLYLKRDKSTPIGLDDAGADLLSAIDGGTGTTVEVLSIPRDYSVTPKKTTFFTNGGKNLFNKEDITEGYYSNIAIDGDLSVLASYGVSDFIPVLPNKVYTKNITQQMPFFDENKQFVSGIDTSITFTTPSNCAYVRINFELKDRDIIQLELGNSITVYEDYTETIIPRHLGHAGKVTFEPSKNLFDKSKALEGYYVPSTSGRPSKLPGYYVSDYIPVIAGQVYTKNDGQQFAYYDVNKQYMSGVEAGTTFTVPSNVSFARFSVRDTGAYSVDTFQVEKGSSTTLYEPYREVISNIERVIKDKGFLTVGKNDADFTSVGEALNSTPGDITIKVLQGTYYEHLDINATNRKVSLIGVDVENTIIRDDSGDYYKTPLNANGNIYVENITFLSTHDDGTDYTIPAYAVHLDRAGAGVATFRNCKMTSYQNSGVGIGTHQDQKIVLDNCEIIKLSERDGGALYLHNAQMSNVANQSLVVKNCLIKTDVGFAIKVDDANTYNGGTNSPMDITFQFNILDSGTRSKDQRVWYRDAPINGGVSGQIKLTSDSFGNNDESLNG